VKIICDCGAITELIDGEDSSDYTEGEGWYKVNRGDVSLYGEHDVVCFKCEICDREEWIFT